MTRVGLSREAGQRIAREFDHMTVALHDDRERPMGDLIGATLGVADSDEFRSLVVAAMVAGNLSLEGMESERRLASLDEVRHAALFVGFVHGAMLAAATLRTINRDADAALP